MSLVGALPAGVFLLIVVLSTFLGLHITRFFRWESSDNYALAQYATGFILAPFVFGIVSIATIQLLSGGNAYAQLAGVIIALCGLGTAVCWGTRDRSKLPMLRPILRELGPANRGLRCLGCAVALVLALHVLLVLLVPLVQNDALEYMLAAREMFATRDLASYPVLNPEANVTGFFGPWTHPPLYVVMIYVTNVIQGDPVVPVLMRLISSWFFLAASVGVFALGSVINRRVAYISALLFMTPPLLFLGASGGLIDPLPVAGMTLILLVLAAVRGTWWQLGVALGMAVGVSLWTHSQAVLFVLLSIAGVVALLGLGQFFRTAGTILVMIVTAALLGSWPYVRNVLLFGAPVSDEPAVFAVPELSWQSYFNIGRGLDNLPAAIQYGLFKGWFAWEAYGLVFWGMLFGLGFMLGSLRLSVLASMVRQGAASIVGPQRIMLLFATVFLTYLTGVGLSIAVGIDHLIKNERYLLVMMPIVGVISAYGILRLLEAMCGVVSTLAPMLVSLGVIGQAIFFSGYMIKQHNVHQYSPFASYEEKVFSIAQFQSLRALDALDEDQAFVLSLRPADMLYASNRMLSYLDERLIPFYETENANTGLNLLKDLGVRYVHVPDYSLPPQYNSVLYRILGDPELSRLIEYGREGSLYELAPSRLSRVHEVDLTPGVTSWLRESFFRFGGRRDVGAITLSRHQFAGGLSEDDGIFGLFHRNTGVALTVGHLTEQYGYEKDVFDPVDGHEYVFEFEVSGYGLIRILVIEEYLDAVRGWVPRTNRIATFELDRNRPERDYRVRLRPDDEVAHFSLVIEHIGVSRIQIQEVKVTIYGEV